jgi:NadR type nicotinamide-nucleotide adenylyltransferase
LRNYLEYLNALQQPVKRIVIIGPESTGKSTLTRQLAAHFGTSYADEFARVYLEGLSRPYNEEDLWHIAEGQVRYEDEAIAAARNGLCFFDTDLYVTKVWSEDKYGTCAESILQQIACRPYHLYLLTDIDMPWEDDPLREHGSPEERQYFFNIYYDIVQQSGVPFTVVRGTEAGRLEQAVTAVRLLNF